jgi:hypothetical protein
MPQTLVAGGIGDKFFLKLTRDRAKQLCSRLESAGGSCLVYRN